MKKDFIALRTRYLNDAPELQIGGLASNLSRIGWFMRRSASFEKFQPIIRESKFFAEWSVENVSDDLRNALAQIQIDLAILERDIAHGKHTSELSELPESWSEKLLFLAGLNDGKE